jgi:uncharacterized membrane protein
MFGERSRWLTIGFALSVLANLFLAGVIVGALTIPAFIRNAPPQMGLVPRAQIRELPIAERAAFAAVVRRHSGEIRTLHERVREARIAAEQAIGAPHYDRALLEKRFAAVREAQLAQQVVSHAAVIEALGTLSDKSRAAIARGAERNAESAP